MKEENSIIVHHYEVKGKWKGRDYTSVVTVSYLTIEESAKITIAKF